MTRDNYCAKCGGEPSPSCAHGTVTDLDVNLDELGMACARHVPACEEMAFCWLDMEGRDEFNRQARWYRIRQIALWAAFYVEYELRKPDGKHDAVRSVLADLEERTCSPGNRELRTLLDDLK